MEQKTYGYVRVSSKDQNEARQLDALTEYPIPLENIFVDKKAAKISNGRHGTRCSARFGKEIFWW